MKLYNNKIIMLFMLTSVSNYSFALQELNDVSLSQLTGQDGISLSLTTAQDITATISWNDTDGIEAGKYGLNSTHISAPASVVMGDGTATDTFRVSKGTTSVKIDSDGRAAGAYVNIAIKLPEDLTVNTGSIYVAKKSNTDISQYIAGNHQYKTKIMDNVQILLNGVNANINLGSQPQGGFAVLGGTIENGLQINNIKIFDTSVTTANSGIGIEQIVLRDNLGSDLTMDSIINIVPAGVDVKFSSNKKLDVLANNIKLGNLTNSHSIGDVAIVGLDLAGQSLRIAGH